MFADREIATGELEPCGLPEHEDCGLRLVLDRLGERWTGIGSSTALFGESGG